MKQELTEALLMRSVFYAKIWTKYYFLKNLNINTGCFQVIVLLSTPSLSVLLFY